MFIRILALFLFTIISSTRSVAYSALYRVSGEVGAEYHRMQAASQTQSLNSYWQQDQLQYTYGNLRYKSLDSINGSEISLVFRSYRSDEREQSQYLDKMILPVVITSRTLWDFSHKENGKHSHGEIDFNKLHYTYQARAYSMSLGRMVLNYGKGITTNPINPFNGSSFLTNARSFAQGVDGVFLNSFIDGQYNTFINFIFNHEAALPGEKVNLSPWFISEMKLNRNVNFTIQGGKDLYRDKGGAELVFNSDDGFTFLQVAYQTANQLENESDDAFDFVIGVEQEYSSLLKFHLEFGRQEKSPYAFDHQDSNRTLPQEHYISGQCDWAIFKNGVLHERLLYDPRTQFLWLSLIAQMKLSPYLYWNINGSAPAKIGDRLNRDQKIYPYQIGSAIFARF